MCVTVGPAGGKDGEGGGDRRGGGEGKEAEAEILEEHATLCRELLQVEENSKWALLTLLFLLSLQQEGLEARGGGEEELRESFCVCVYVCVSCVCKCVCVCVCVYR